VVKNFERFGVALMVMSMQYDCIRLKNKAFGFSKKKLLLEVFLKCGCSKVLLLKEP